MSEENKNQDSAQESKSINPADYEKAIERARRFEAQVADFEKQLARYKDIDPDKYKAITEDYENLRREKAQGNPDEIDKLIRDKEAEIDSRYQKRFGSKVEELETKTQQYERELKELRVTSVVMAKAGQFIQPTSIRLLKPFVEKYCEHQDGKVVVKDDDGNVRYSPTNPRELMTVDEFLSEFAEENGISVDRSKRGTMNGVGNQSGTNGHGNISVEKFMSMTAEQRAELPPSVFAELADKALGRRHQPLRK